MGWLEAYKPGMAMIVVQVVYAVMTVVTREAMLKGMSSTIFLVYRQTIATLVLGPIAIISSFYRKDNNRPSIKWKSFWLIFMTALIGVAINQNLYFEGVLLASSSIGAAMNNIIPAITFVIAFVFGLERVSVREWRSIAKIVGTALCILGAFIMTLLRGPELFDAALPPMLLSILGASTTWFIGCACIFASNCFWSTWLILQAKITQVYPDHLASSAWMCFLAAIQSAAIALCIERDFDKWVLDTPVDIASVTVAGVGGSALAFFLQAYCISKRGPVFSALFNPVCTIVTTVLAAIFLKEDIYLGSLVGAIIIIVGLYIVLWGKAKDVVQRDGSVGSKPVGDEDAVQVLVDDAHEEHREPLLSNS